jgi:tetratricopeptide (TPR) repeat protein
MLLSWLNAREATQAGIALADDFVLQTAGASSGGHHKGAAGKLERFMQMFLQRVDREARPLQLNVFKRAKLANSFKWRLLEKGVELEIVDELTRALVLRLSSSRSANNARAPQAHAPAAASPSRRGSGGVAAMLAKGNECMVRGAYAEAMSCYEGLLSLDSRNVLAHNNLGAAHWKLGHYKRAEEEFRRAIGIREGYPDAHSNLGTVLRQTGRITESETPLRRALKLKPTHVDAQSSLGMTLALRGRLRDARECFEKVLRIAPRNVEALAGIARVAALEGRFDEAGAAYRRVLEVDPNMAAAWAALAQLRKMTSADRDWLAGAEKAAAGGLPPLEEADLRYAIGKYYDDVEEFGRAFRSYQRANELHRTAVEPYDRTGWTRLVDDLIRVYTREVLAAEHPGASDSHRPVFVVGMPRSGTSLVEQIIASHTSAQGAGELDYWAQAFRKHATLCREPPAEGLAQRLAAGYLRTLEQHSPQALRVVDKTTFNADLMGVVHCVFPRARFIYLRRDPIDSCLSCYFHQLPATLSFCTDLGDLAHYYREHHRLVEHWREALPSGALLDVPYEELTADQEAWTRRIVDFLGLEWDPRCLDFHRTNRVVATASYWQVRQKIYKSSVGRWRHYEKFIGPLLTLRDLES